MIHAVGLTKKFDEFTAVQDVNLDVPKGQVLVLLGPNGAGKTTTVRMLSSVLRPTSGNATVAGFDVIKEARHVRSLVGVLTEQHGLYRRMHARDYLRFFAQINNMAQEVYEGRITQLLSKFGLGDVGKKRLGEYSKGMRQKLALVRALLHDPPVLLLDEPTSAMDPESARMVRDSILGLRTSERTIILCTHNLTEAEELADQIAIIQNGKIIMNDTSAGLKSRLLGPVEYEVQFSSSTKGRHIEMPEGVQLIDCDDCRMRFQIKTPQINNPILLRHLLDHHLDVVSLQVVAQSLEDAYMQAVQNHEEGKGA